MRHVQETVRREASLFSDVSASMERTDAGQFKQNAEKNISKKHFSKYPERDSR